MDLRHSAPVLASSEPYAVPRAVGADQERDLALWTRPLLIGRVFGFSAVVLIAIGLYIAAAAAFR